MGEIRNEKDDKWEVLGKEKLLNRIYVIENMIQVEQGNVQQFVHSVLQKCH